MSAREIQLAARPEGEAREGDFRLAEVELPDPKAGQVLIRNTWMSVDPYMRGRMDDAESYVPPFELGAPLDGGAVGEVIGSEDPSLEQGEVVLHGLGWRDHALAPAGQVRKIDTSIAPPQAYLGVLGMPGLTAYAGLIEVAGLREGDVVFVSGAAGAVGGLAGQIAKLRGHRVIGSAGSPEKVEYVTGELGFDAAFNYRDGPVAELLAEAAPDGIDVYFDNVGGDHLEAAIGALNLHGRVAMCGAISGYDASGAEPPPGPRNLKEAIGKRLNLRGFIVGDHRHLRDDFTREIGTWLSEGRIRYRETVVDGLENAPAAFLGMLHGDNIGKMLVRLDGGS
jgi:NADPH-dependent curcumin reductase CurA